MSSPVTKCLHEGCEERVRGLWCVAHTPAFQERLVQHEHQWISTLSVVVVTYYRPDLASRYGDVPEGMVAEFCQVHDCPVYRLVEWERVRVGLMERRAA